MQQTNLLNITQPSTWTSPLLSVSTSVTCASKFFPNGSKGIKMTRHHGKNSHGKQAKMNVRSDRLAGKYLQYRAAFLHFPKLRISHLYKNPRHLFRWTRCRKTWQNSPPWHQWQVSCHTYIGRRIRHTPTHRLDGILLVRQITPRTPTSTFLSINTWLGSYQPWHIFTDDPPIR